MNSKPFSLVTGGAGFIGRHVASHLLSRGENVVVLDDLSGGYEENVPAGAEFVKGSIIDHYLIDSLFDAYQFEKVYHLAAYAAENLSHFIKRFNYTNNLIGSVNLINAAVNHKTSCFVFTSSAAVYGNQPASLTEDIIPQPEDSYGIAKLAVERELRVSHELFGLNYVIFRPHNVYGEYQNTADKYRNVIGIFINQLMGQSPLTIFGDGEQTRAFTHVDDVAPLIAEAADNPAAYLKTFNLGSDDAYTLNQLAEIVQRAYGRNVGVVHLPARSEVKHVQCSHEMARRILGYQPRVSLPDGVERMIAWAKQIGVRTPREFSEIEIWKNMPPSWVPAKAG